MPSVATMVAPERFTSMVNSSPMGPWPRITTTSSAWGSSCTTPFRQVFKRLDEAGAVEGNVFGDLLDAAADDPVHHADVLRESAAGRFIAGSHARPSCTRGTGRRACGGSRSIPGRGYGGRPPRDRLAENPRTPAPAAATTPAVSWPKMRGGASRLYSIFFRSVWQMPQLSTRTSSSPGPIWGVGTSSTETVLAPV